ACLKKPLRAARASPLIFRLSHSLVTRMYQLPMLMITRIIRVPRATKSPCAHSALRPYGLSTVSLVVVAVSAGAGAAAGVVSAAGALASAATGALAAPCAATGSGTATL